MGEGYRVEEGSLSELGTVNGWEGEARLFTSSIRAFYKCK
jgi:hypothetical protein